MKDLTGRVSNKADETIRTETEIDQVSPSHLYYIDLWLTV